MKSLIQVIKRPLSALFISAIALTPVLGAAPAMAESTAPPAGGGTGSNSRVQTFVGMGAGKQEITQEDIEGLEPSDWRSMGLFMSNFYTPYVTEFGASAAEDEEVTTSYQASMKEVLTTSLKYDEATADKVVAALANWIKNDSQELKLGFTTKVNPAGSDITDVSELPLNYPTLQGLLSGIYPAGDIASTASAEDRAFYEKYADKRYWVLYSGDKKIAAVGDRGLLSGGKVAMTLTPSTIALKSASMFSDPKMGYGSSLYDMVKRPGEEINVETIGEETNAYDVSVFNSTLRISPFGDIIFMGPNHQYPILPGAMNPYAWTNLKETDGSVRVPLQNLQMVTAGAKGWVTGSKGLAGICTNENVQSTTKWTDFRGSGETNTGLGATFGWGQNASATPVSDSFEAGFKADYKNTDLIPWDNGKLGDTWTDAPNPYFGVMEGIRNNGIWQEGFHPVNAPVCQQANDFSTVIAVDSLGVYSGSDASFNPKDTFQALEIQSDGGAISLNGSETTLSSGSSPWGSTYAQGEVAPGFTVVAGTESGMEAAYSTLFLTYALANEGMVSDSKSQDMLGYKISADLPTMGPADFSVSEDVLKEQRLEDIINWTYYLLNPSAFEYVVQWADVKIGGILLNWHHDMTGTKNVGMIAGTTQYGGFSGYVTTPALDDQPWTKVLVDGYNSIVPFLIIAVVVLMLLYAVVGVMGFWRAIIGAIVFAIVAFLPATMINTAVDVSNSASNAMYTSKFSYWALIQQQTYAQELDKAAEGDSYQSYLKTLTNQQGAAADSITVKWQAPKKMASLMLNDEEKESLGNMSGLVTQMLSNGLDGSQYLNEPSTYFYRSFWDISNFSRYIYASLTDGKVPVGDIPAGKLPEGLQASLSTANADFAEDRTNGFTNAYGNGSTKFTDQTFLSAPLSSNLVADAMNTDIEEIRNLSQGEFVGIDQRYFQFSLPMLTQYGDGGKGTFADSLSADGFTTDPNYNESDLAGLASYGLMSESPYYYYSWQLYASGLETAPSKSGGLKNLLLQGKEGYYFYNVNGQGADGEEGGTGTAAYADGNMKDFLDMKSMFTYVIPYLNHGNNAVRAWDSVYGVKIYEGISTEEGKEADYADDPVAAQQYWHNVNVARLYNIYSPWVDLMYDSPYAEPEVLTVAGERVTVEDPINPASYPEGRPMIFSQSEANAYGLNNSQLTKVELKIIEVEKKTQEKLFTLLNYHTFNDSVLNTVGSMEATFVFNQVFSDNNFLGESHVLEPQGYELKNFNYDAFLRMILSNSTGDMITEVDESYNGDFYAQMADKSSWTFNLMLLISDFMAIYVIPLFRFFSVLMIFALAVLMIFSTLLKTRENIFKHFIQGLVLPLIGFLAISIGMAAVVSFFLGSGSTAVTGDTGVSIRLGDPALTMVLMLLINLIAIVLYVLLGWNLGKRIWEYGKEIGKSVGTVLQSVGVKAMSAVQSRLEGTRVGQMAGAIGSSLGTSAGSGSQVNGTAPSGPTPTRRETAENDATDREKARDRRRQQANDKRVPKKLEGYADGKKPSESHKTTDGKSVVDGAIKGGREKLKGTDDNQPRRDTRRGRRAAPESPKARPGGSTPPPRAPRSSQPPSSPSPRKP